MLKILAACGSGMGSSQIIKMKIEKIFKEKGVEIEIHHSGINEAKETGGSYDVLFCSAALTGNFAAATEAGTVVVGLKNLLSEQEMRDKIENEVIGKTINPC